MRLEVALLLGLMLPLPAAATMLAPFPNPCSSENLTLRLIDDPGGQLFLLDPRSGRLLEVFDVVTIPGPNSIVVRPKSRGLVLARYVNVAGEMTSMKLLLFRKR